VRGAIIMFVTRTIVLGFALLTGPYLLYEKFSNFRAFTISMDIINIFQFIIDVIRKKDLLQFMFYVFLLLYSSIFTFMIIHSTYKVRGLHPESSLLGLTYLCVYTCVLVSEVVLYNFMYCRLRKDSVWSNF
jgi:hypothetical protein